MARRVVLLLGRQGAGKGTQGRWLAERMGVPHVESGAMLRDAVAAGTEIGTLVEPLVEAGELVPDEIVITAVLDRLAQPDAQAGAVLDGFPRNVAQAEALAAALEPDGIEAAVELAVPVDVARERMAGRRRMDDTPEAIERRLRRYDERVGPLLEWLSTRTRVERVDATRSPDEVAEALAAAVGEN